MKSIWRKLFYGFGMLTLAGVLMAMVAGSAKVRAQASDDDDGFGKHGLGGTWKVTVNLSNCATGALIGKPFYSYLSFAGNGTMAENTSNPGFATGQRGPGLGIWSHTGWRTYNAKSIAFIAFTTPSAPPTNPGFMMGTQTIMQTIKLDGPDEFTSAATIEFADTTDNVYRNGCAVATGTRFQ